MSRINGANGTLQARCVKVLVYGIAAKEWYSISHNKKPIAFRLSGHATNLADGFGRSGGIAVKAKPWINRLNGEAPQATNSER